MAKGGPRTGSGAKAKPLALAILQGNPGRKKLNLDQPPCSPLEAQPLQFLNDRQQFWFRYYANAIADLGLNSATYEAVLTAAALRTDEIETCGYILEKEGMSYPTETQNGSTIWKMRPEQAQRNEALRHLHSLLAELGLTPSSINRIKSGKGEQQSDPFQDLLNGK